jgi:hypothetical protein
VETYTIVSLRQQFSNAVRIIAGSLCIINFIGGIHPGLYGIAAVMGAYHALATESLRRSERIGYIVVAILLFVNALGYPLPSMIELLSKR